MAATKNTTLKDEVQRIKRRKLGKGKWVRLEKDLDECVKTEAEKQECEQSLLIRRWTRLGAIADGVFCP